LEKFHWVSRTQLFQDLISHFGSLFKSLVSDVEILHTGFPQLEDCLLESKTNNGIGKRLNLCGLLCFSRLKNKLVEFDRSSRLNPAPPTLITSEKRRRELCTPIVTQLFSYASLQAVTLHCQAKKCIHRFSPFDTQNNGIVISSLHLIEIAVAVPKDCSPRWKIRNEREVQMETKQLNASENDEPK
jgi:hypothetical protein